ncbi:MAG: substrate-binding domain-containing protein [Ktedonobacterales bacterium]|nr:substrate-binding domain-containing protein [Ktedonobacterales bacterium]
MRFPKLNKLLIIGATAGMLALSGCGASTAASSGGGGPKTIGFSVYDMQYGYFQTMEKGTHAAATAAGYNYKLFDEKSSESNMVSGTQDLLNQGISALIISPFQPGALGPIVDAAHAKKIPVVVDDIGGGSSNYDAIVISDNANGGKLAADEMDKELKAAGKTGKKVASITCEPSAVYAARRNVGFDAEITTLGYTVVSEVSGHSKQEEGYKDTQDILNAHPDIVGIFSCNDPMAVGAAQALKDAGKSGAKDVIVVGFNGDQIALDAIKNGQMAATVQQQPDKMGAMTVDLATKLINKTAITFDNPGAREIYVPVNLITKANLPTS